MPYAKVYREIGTSSINEEELHTRWLFVIMLVNCARDGCLRATRSALARLANITTGQADSAIAALTSPDEHSTTKVDDGRRVVEVEPNVWQIVNYSRYREMKDPETEREEARERQRRSRRRRAGLPEDGGPCAYCGDPATGPDHIVPGSQGGTDVVLCCSRCNQFKGTMAVADFLNANPRFVDPDLVMASPILRRYVSFDGHLFTTCHMPSQDIRDVRHAEAEAYAEREAEAKKDKDVGAETRGARSTPDTSAVILTYPCDGKVSTWNLTENYLTRLRELYPALDVMSEARKALAWIEANREQRKTARGMPSFIVRWLNREQDSPRRSAGRSADKPGGKQWGISDEHRAQFEALEEDS